MIKNRHIVFSIDSLIFSSPLISVSKIMELSDYELMPHAPGFILGEAYVDDQHIPIVNLKSIFATPHKEKIGKVLIVYKSDPHPIALMADYLEQITDLDESEVFHDKFIVTNESSLLKGSYRYKKRTAHIIDLTGVMSLDYFKNLESPVDHEAGDHEAAYHLVEDDPESELAEDDPAESGPAESGPAEAAQPENDTAGDDSLDPKDTDVLQEEKSDG